MLFCGLFKFTPQRNYNNLLILEEEVEYIPPYWRSWCLKFQGNPAFSFYISSRENKETERDTEGVGLGYVNSTKVIYRLAFQRVCFPKRPHKYHFPCFSKSFSSTKRNTTWSAITSKILNGSSNARSRLPLCGRPENRLPFQMAI